MKISMTVTKRDHANGAKKLRQQGLVPAVVYGSTFESASVAVEAKQFDAVMKAAGESAIINLTGLDKPLEVLIKQVDFSPIKQVVEHVDFYVVNKGQEITTNIPLVFFGEAPVVESGLGTINEVHRDVPVTCEPANLPAEIKVDLSGLKTVDDKILVENLKVPKGVVIDLPGGEAVAVVSGLNIEPEEEIAESVEPAAVVTPST